MPIGSFGKASGIGRPSYRAYPLDRRDRIEGPAIALTAQTDDDALHEAQALIGDDRLEVWCGARRLTLTSHDVATFRVTEALDQLIEVEHVATGHRMTFCVQEDRTDVARGSFKEHPAAHLPLTKDSWDGAYFCAKRAATLLGLIRVASSDPGISLVT